MRALPELQAYMREQRIDAWLIYDFRGNNPVLAQLLPGKHWTTRRAALLVPASGAPELLAHGIDFTQFDGVAVARTKYLSWNDWQAWLRDKIAGCTRVAMEYSPGGALPAVAVADAGTVELVRAFGAEVVSSANLIQVCVARWRPEALANHELASRQVGQIKDEAFEHIRRQLAAGAAVNEYEVQQLIMRRFAELGLETPDAPIVAVNAHSGDPHFEVSASQPAAIRRGDWVLIDLWARRPGEENIFSDITWVAFAGREPSARQREVFEAVRRARDAALQAARDGWKSGATLQGWQLDEAARAPIIEAGFGDFIRHRTGHSLSPGPKVHGLGVNLDNLETHDTRDVLPGIGFTIEPGIYLPEFGVRLEIDVYADPHSGPRPTSVVQDEIVLLG